jgi:cytochrome P450
VSREVRFPLGASLTLDQLDVAPHPALASLREREPVSWVPCLEGWLVTRYDVAAMVMGDAAMFTAEDPRFSTGQVIGPSMLSLDGGEHARHRAPFAGPLRPRAVAQQLTSVVEEQVDGLIDALEPLGQMELRRQFAGPLAAAVIAEVLGLGEHEVDDLLGWYEAIVSSVTSITAGRGPTAQGADAYAALQRRLEPVVRGGHGRSVLAAVAAEPPQDGALSHDEIAANAAILLFGGIETTEGMIANAALELLRHPELGDRIQDEPALLGPVIDESLRFEPAAAIVDRYATTDCVLGAATVRQGELVRVSITGANRDPAVFGAPDDFDPLRPNLRRHLAFAQGAHVCLGVHLARLEARAALTGLLERLPGLRPHPERPAGARGLVFRKPPRLDVIWEA